MELLVPLGLGAFLLVLILFGAVRYPSVVTHVLSNDAAVVAGYTYLSDTHVFVFFGFGFLMSFLYRNGVTAISHSLMAAGFAALWGILNRGLWAALIDDRRPPAINMDFTTIVSGEFAAATVLVSLGALIGRLSAAQALLLAFFEVPLYTINVALSNTRYRTTDFGGSLQIFVFGSVFGLACSFVMDARASRARPGAVIRSSRASDISAMLGSLFMWMFWPSFNAVLAPTADIQKYVVTNTYLSLAMGTVMTFTAQHVLWDGKFNMNEVQYATLAGGVAMGVASNWAVQPFGALLIGSLSSLFSVLGYRFVSPFLSRRLFLNDTCGVVNAYTIPGLAGGFASVIAAGAASAGAYASFSGAFTTLVASGRSAGRQAGFQLLLIGTSVGFPLVAGALVGFILTLVDDLRVYYDDAEEFVDDACVATS